MNSQKWNLIRLTGWILCWSFVTHLAHAEVLRWPQGCLSGQLEVKNTTTAGIRAWLQKFKPTLIEETEFSFAAKSVAHIPVTAAEGSESFSLLHFKTSGSLQAVFKCQAKRFPAHSFEGGVLTYRKSDLSQNKLWIQNLFTAENNFSIDFLDHRFQVLSNESLKLKSMGNLIFLASGPSNWSYLRIQAQNRFAAYNLNSLGSEGPWIIQSQKLPSIDHTAFFVVGSRDNIGDNFIVKISDPNLIAKAREQISNSSLEKIVFAKIQQGHGGYNRNWSKKEKSFWSWSVTEVTNIADLGSTSCNGLPQAVEDRVTSWVNDSGRICFWSYRIKQELTPSEVASGETLQ